MKSSHYSVLQTLERLYNEVERAELKLKELGPSKAVKAMERSLDALTEAQDLVKKEVERRRHLRERYEAARNAGG